MVTTTTDQRAAAATVATASCRHGVCVGALGLFLALAAVGLGAEPTADRRVLYVNNQTGSDALDGLAVAPAGDGVSGPVATIQRAFALARTSDRIEIANTGTPYPGGNTLVAAGGTAERPLLVNGNQAQISGLGRVPAEKWTRVREGIVCTDFWPMSNLLKGYREIQWWIGTPQIWWLDGQPAPNCRTEAELDQTEGGFFWNKPLKQVWVHLPHGRTLDQVRIEIPVHGTCVCVNTDFVVVHDLRAFFSSNDGFDCHGNGKNIVYQRCIATDNCGQGFSVHDTNVALYEDCLAERNASSGSCDVNECHSYYRRCVFANNSFEAGVYAHDESQHTYEDCLIVGNQPFEQVWQRGFSRMNFVNCVILGLGAEPKGLLSLDGGAIRLRQCTLADGAYLCRFSGRELGSLSIVDCVLTRCREPFLVLPDAPNRRCRLSGNVYFDGPGLQVGARTFTQSDWAEYQKLTGLDADSEWQDPGLVGPLAAELPPDSPLRAWPGAQGKRRVGAQLPASVWELYAQTRRDVATPRGVRSRDAD